MPTPVKPSASMAKNLTAAERAARLAAEESIVPARERIALKKPSWLTGKGLKYWRSIIKRMEGLYILDDLDAETLAIYCAQLVERDALQADLRKAREPEDGLEPDMDLILSITKQLNAKDAQVLKYGSELGCTPAGRIRLAQKRASAATNEPDGDLFGD